MYEGVSGYLELYVVFFEMFQFSNISEGGEKCPTAFQVKVLPTAANTDANLKLSS